MKIKKEDLKMYLKVIETFQLMSLFAIIVTYILDFKHIQLNSMNYITDSIIIQLSMLIIPVLSCLVFYFLKHHYDNKYEEFRKNIPEYVYKNEYYSTEPLSDKSEKIKITNIKEKCNINGYGYYDPNNS